VEAKRYSYSQKDRAFPDKKALLASVMITVTVGLESAHVKTLET